MVRDLVIGRGGSRSKQTAVIAPNNVNQGVRNGGQKDLHCEEHEGTESYRRGVMPSTDWSGEDSSYETTGGPVQARIKLTDTK